MASKRNVQAQAKQLGAKLVSIPAGKKLIFILVAERGYFWSYNMSNEMIVGVVGGDETTLQNVWAKAENVLEHGYSVAA